MELILESTKKQETVFRSISCLKVISLFSTDLSESEVTERLMKMVVYYTYSRVIFFTFSGILGNRFHFLQRIYLYFTSHPFFTFHPCLWLQSFSCKLLFFQLAGFTLSFHHEAYFILKNRIVWNGSIQHHDLSSFL